MVLLPATVWRELVSIRDGAPPDAPVFASRITAGFLSTTQVRRLVYAAATAAGLDDRPSPHWLRHAPLRMPLSVARPSTWFRRHSAIPRWPPTGRLAIESGGPLYGSNLSEGTL